MTSFALIAGMLPVAVGNADGAEFYRPLAVAIFGGTLTSTLRTLLAVPTFYGSIEQACAGIGARVKRGRALGKADVVATVVKEAA